MMRIFPLSAALALAGCGLSPVYQGGAAGPVATTLATIEVGPIPDKAGWLVRNCVGMFLTAC